MEPLMVNEINLYKQIYGYPNTVFEPFDYRVGLFLSTRVKDHQDEAFLVGCYMSMQQRLGNIAVNTNQLFDKPFHQWPDINIDSISAISYPLLRITLSASHLDSFMGDGILKDANKTEFTSDLASIFDDSPLVRYDEWIYLLRYWRYETKLVDYFQRNLDYRPVISENEIENIEIMTNDEINWQQVAVRKALIYPVTIITGGPGTGKTFTILSVLSELLKRRPTTKIALCAPTGKAAARMMESIEKSLAVIEGDYPTMPNEAVTIHRLIGWNPGKGKSKYHAGNKLPYDLVILDEASMVDLALLSRLMIAIPEQGRLIMLGDKDQLASVEAGSVFGEIASVDHGSFDVVNFKTENVHYADIFVRLRESRRFSSESGIGLMAEMVNSSNSSSSWAWLKEQNSIKDCHSGNYAKWIEEIIVKAASTHDKIISRIENLREFISSEKKEIYEIGTKINEIFETLSGTQILSAHRRGIFGSVHLNNRIDAILSDKRVSQSYHQKNQSDGWYNGRPIIVTANDYELGLFNGDVGLAVVLNDQIKITFGYDSHANTIRWFSPAQLYNVETSWVLTVHKSQGSEFENVELIIPDELSPVLTRELAYTALTRSKKSFTLWGTETIWRDMINRKIERKSGLGKRLLL